AAIAYAVQLAGDGRRRHGGRVSDQGPRATARRVRIVRYFDTGKPAPHYLRRSLRADLARRPPVVVFRRRIHPHEFRFAGFEAYPSEGRPVLPMLGREEPVKAGRGRPL